ncbi:MAG: hypothetical protein LBD71_07690, partial [Treponema sp.]|nr:hypothetical protein [Treponema sp.]
CRAGAAVVVKAIADGKAAAAGILRRLGLSADFTDAPRGAETAFGAGNVSAFNELYRKKGIIAEAKKSGDDGIRCLSCNALCEICTDVCPNRANVMIELASAPGALRGTRQIVHIDRMCNECGNCATFCPHAGKPYRDKFTIFSNGEDFSGSENPGFLKTGEDAFLLRLEDKSELKCRKGDAAVPPEYAAVICAAVEKYPYLIMQ